VNSATHMAFRLMRYAMAAMQRHLDAGHSKLPLVIPVLFCAGKRSPYPCTRWLDEFDAPALTDRPGNVLNTVNPARKRPPAD